MEKNIKGSQMMPSFHVRLTVKLLDPNARLHWTVLKCYVTTAAGPSNTQINLFWVFCAINYAKSHKNTHFGQNRHFSKHKHFTRSEIEINMDQKLRKLQKMSSVEISAYSRSTAHPTPPHPLAVEVFIHQQTTALYVHLLIVDITIECVI